MTPPLFLVPDVSGDVVELTGADAHHAAVVKRLTPGEIVLVADGHGSVARAEVVTAGRTSVRLLVRERWSQPVRQPSLIVVQALPKGERAELAVEVLTELGVDEIIPWAAARSISVWRDDKVAKGVEKWRRVAFEASKQSRRSRIPRVAELASTGDVVLRLRGARAIVLHEDATALLADVAMPTAGEVLLIVGPEGGISTAELEGFVAAGAMACKLGPEVLRTSTAGAAALAVLSAATGRWR